MKRRVGAVLGATLGLLLSAAPAFAQTSGYPPGPTTTSTAPGGSGGVLGLTGAPGGTGGPGGLAGAPGGSGGPGGLAGAPGGSGGTGGLAIVEPVVLAQAPPPAAAVAAAAPRAGTRVAVTGANAVRLASIGLVLFMSGVLLVTATRRRRVGAGYLPG